MNLNHCLIAFMIHMCQTSTAHYKYVLQIKIHMQCLHLTIPLKKKDHRVFSHVGLLYAVMVA